MDLSRVHNSRAEGASYSCLAEGTFYACSLKHERVSLCNKRARAARTICVMYAHNAIITSDERKKERKEREEKGTSRGRSIRVRMFDACVQCTRICTLLLFATFANIRYRSFNENIVSCKAINSICICLYQSRYSFGCCTQNIIIILVE